MITLNTLTLGIPFSYDGSVETGLRLHVGREQRRTVRVSKEQLNQLLYRFIGQTVPAGCSYTDRPNESIGQQLLESGVNVAVGSYVAPILIAEGYAELIAGNIRIYRLPRLQQILELRRVDEPSPRYPDGHSIGSCYYPHPIAGFPGGSQSYPLTFLSE